MIRPGLGELAQAAEHAGALRLRHRHADHLGGARDARSVTGAPGQASVWSSMGPGLAAADLEDQARDALDVLDGQRRVDAALEAVPGVGRS